MNAAPQIERSDSHPDPGRKYLLWLFGVAISIWGFDFKALHGQSASGLQGLILVVYVAAIVWIWASAAKRGLGAGPLWVLVSLTSLFLLESATVGFIKGQPFHDISVNLIPLFLFMSASSITYLALSIGRDDTGLFLNVLRCACIASGIAHLFMLYLTRGGINLATSRFEVLSGAVMPSVGIIAVGLSQQLAKLDVVVLLLHLTISMLSVTRTLVVVLGVQIAMVLLASPSVIFGRTTRRGVALIALVLLSIFALDTVAGTGLASRWGERFFLGNKLGTDPSKLLRIAETHFMWDHFTASPEQLMFGNGLAAVTSAYGREDAQVAVLVGSDAAEVHMIGFGHENYASILFAGGLVGGGGLFLMQGVLALHSVLAMRRLQLGRLLYRKPDIHVGVWGAVIVMGMVTVGFLSDTFGDRGECLWFGIGTGMLYWIRGVIRENAAERKR
jgi:hypothetical protein